jgi:hypothetical protein
VLERLPALGVVRKEGAPTFNSQSQIFPGTKKEDAMSEKSKSDLGEKTGRALDDPKTGRGLGDKTGRALDDPKTGRGL